ncbi:MAG: hypothetical protein IKB75_02320 [Clostridia bacterium]|nr:hypothetical protein [Clostridia bacterium]
MKPRHKYLLQFSIVFAIYLTIPLSLYFFHLTYWTIIAALVLWFPFRSFAIFLQNKNFFNILMNELDAQKFYNVVYEKPSFYPISCRLDAEWFVGNYAKLIALSSASLKNAKTVRWKASFLSYLARAYFEMHDHENLAKTVDAFYELPKYTRNPQRFLAKYPNLQYYKAYLDKDFEKCVTLIEKRTAYLEKKARNDKLYGLINRSNLAVEYYEIGEFEKAKEIFQQLMEVAPKMDNFYELSIRYINAIEHNESPTLTLQVNEEESAKAEYEFCSTQKRRKRENIIRAILMGILLTFLVSTTNTLGTAYATYNEHKTYAAEFDAKLNDAISRKYDSDAKFIEYFVVMNGEDPLEAFCLVEVDGRLDLTSAVTPNNGETANLILLLEDIKIPGEYTVESAVSVYKITFYISDERLSESEYQQIVKYSHNGTNYWFGIKDVFSTIPAGPNF